MIIEPRKQQNLGPMAVILFMIAALIYMPVLINGIDQTNETGVSGGHSNHIDTQTTPLPGNTCPNGCPWPDCGCNGPVLTLQPTVYISPIATFNPATTPDVPDPVNNATVFPTLPINPLPTVPSTVALPTLIPTKIPPSIPTIERSIRDVDRPDGTGGGID